MIHGEEDDDFYELELADYYNLFSNRMEGKLYALLILFEKITFITVSFTLHCVNRNHV
jgi:hypothetical protein